VSIEFVDKEPKLDFVNPTTTKVEVRRGGQTVTFNVVYRSRRMLDKAAICGFAYAERTPQTVMAIAELMYSDQSVLQDRLIRRQIRKNFFWGTSRFALWSLTESLRAIRYSVGLIRESVVQSFEDAPMVLNDNKIVHVPLPAKATETGPVHSGAQLYG
jgi:cellulose synthase (UDP-forming)